MGVRFRKSIKLAPGLRMNLSGSGISWTLGPRGASIGIGKRGTYANTGIPGSGLYMRNRLSSGSSSTSSGSSRSAASATGRSAALTVSIDDDGTLTFKDSNGNPVSEAMVNAAKKQKGDVIRGLIEGKCNEINEQIEALGRIHEYTSEPGKTHEFVKPAFDKHEPFAWPKKTPGFFCRMFKSCVAKVEAENKALQERYEQELADWRRGKADFEAQAAADQAFVERLNAGEPAAIEQYLDSVLQDISWPRETDVTLDVTADGIVAIDVDLPEIEDIPNKAASVPQRGYRLSVKEMSATKVQQLYMRHIHGLGFRIAGEAIAASPGVREVVLSAYSQRTNKATGQVDDEYLYSVRIKRETWSKINFGNLTELDVVAALGQFDLRRDMSKTGVFKAITPFALSKADEAC